MKYYVLALGMLTALPAMAQEHETSYERSAFQNYSAIKPADMQAVAQTRGKVSAKFPGWHLVTDRVSGTATDIYGKTMSLAGNTLTEKAANCMNQYLGALGINGGEWQQTRNLSVQHASFVDYSQWINGHKVIFSDLSFRFTTDGKLQRIKIKQYGHPEAGVLPALDKNTIAPYLSQDLSGISITGKTAENDWVWFPVPTANGYVLRPSWPFHVSGTIDGNIPQELSGYADAITGEILYRYNDVKEAFDVTVKGSVKKDGYTQPASDEPLANLRIRVGTTDYYTDATGVLNQSILNVPVNATVYLQGKWSTVKALAVAGSPTPSTAAVFNTTGTNYVFPVTTQFADRHVNAYYHVNRVHDFMKQFFPSFTGMDFSLPTNVDNTGNTCNAFYSGGNNTINFYAASGCPSFAEIGDIIYHEYGHGINDHFYDDMGKGTMFNGGLNEGSADVWGMSITHDPVLGKGAMGGPNTSIRQYNAVPKVYPKDIKGEVHADGEIIAGAWWDVAVNINSVDTMTQIFTKTYFDTPDGPNGTEGDVYYDILISALLNDDNDNDLSNGSPHFAGIVNAFARHGIYLLTGTVLNHTEIAHQPLNTPITVSADLVLPDTLFFQDLVLYYKSRTHQQFDSVIMVDNGSNHFSAQIPAQDTMGTIMDYYFGVFDLLNSGTVYFPAGFRPDIPADESTIPYQFGLGIAKRQGTDFENTIYTQNWEIGNVSGDNATQGIWIQAAPVASALNSSQGSLVCQPGFDHTSGSGQCLVTGNSNLGASVNANDVDNGKTTVQTPTFDLSNYSNPIVEYYRWYSNDRGSNRSSDWWNVQIHNENIVLWKNIEYTKQSDYNWRRRIFHVTDYVAKERKVQIRFIASDPVNSSQSNNGQSAVEALVDDFFIYDQGFETGIGTTEELKARIYPNPANDKVSIELPGRSTGTIGVYDLMGKDVFSISMNGTQDQYMLDTRQLVPGTYMIIVQTEKTIQSQKVVIAH